MNIGKPKGAKCFFIALHGQLFIRRRSGKNDRTTNDNTIALRRQTIPKARCN
ncbi:hypothetical protein D3C81_1698540 [compost metagenome]